MNGLYNSKHFNNSTLLLLANYYFTQDETIFSVIQIYFVTPGCYSAFLRHRENVAIVSPRKGDKYIPKIFPFLVSIIFQLVNITDTEFIFGRMFFLQNKRIR